MQSKLGDLNVPHKAFGYSLWWAWLFLAFFPGAAASYDTPHSLDPLSFLVGVLVFITVAVVASRLPQKSLRTSNPTQVATVILCVLGTFLVTLPEYFGLPESMITIAGVCLSGIGSALMQLMWGELHATLRSKYVFVATIGSFLLAWILTFFLMGRGMVSILVTAALPILSVLVSRTPGDRVEKEKARMLHVEGAEPIPPVSDGRTFAGIKVTMPVTLLLFIVVYGLALGIIGSLFAPAPTMDHAILIDSLVATNIVMGGALFLLVLFLPGAITEDMLLRIVLPMVAVGTLMFSLVGPAGATISWAIIISGLRCCEILIWIITVGVARHSGHNPLLTFCWGCGGSQLGILTGSALCRSPLADLSSTTQIMSVLVFVMLLLIIGVTVVTGRRPLPVPPRCSDGGISDSISSESAFESRLDRVAREAGLSSREREVFEQISRGRTTVYVAERLCIAPSTAATHVRNIYQKLGVHNRQELHDLVDGETTN